MYDKKRVSKFPVREEKSNPYKREEVYMKVMKKIAALLLALCLAVPMLSLIHIFLRWIRQKIREKSLCFLPL